MSYELFDAVIGAFGAVTTLALGAMGLFFVHRYSRQMRTQLAEARRTAYAELWEITGLAAATRLRDGRPGGPLSREERDRLYQNLTSWYYRNGNGMLLDRDTRAMYLNAKHNLNCAKEDLRPRYIRLGGKHERCVGLMELFSKEMNERGEDAVRGCLSIRQLSLLRTQMKIDLAVYGAPYVDDLHRHEYAFLKHSRIHLDRTWIDILLERLPMREPKPWLEAARNIQDCDHCDESREES